MDQLVMPLIYILIQYIFLWAVVGFWDKQWNEMKIQDKLQTKRIEKILK